jgi:hypothetical protein
MTKERAEKRSESGGTLLEFTFVAVTFFMMLLAITAGANLYFTHNALVEATRRGARFATTQAAHSPAVAEWTTPPGTTCDTTGPNLVAIQNFAIYGNSAGTGPKIFAELQRDNICVNYSKVPVAGAAPPMGFGVGTGAVTVSITGFNFNLVIPFVGRQVAMPAYRTTLGGESAGTLPSPACGP